VGLSLVAAHELGGLEDVAVERPVELVTVRPRLEVELGVERVEAEEVAVAAVRRAGAGVASRSEAVAPFARRGLALIEAVGARIDAPREPMGEGAHRGVRVIHDEGQEARSRRRAREGQRWRGLEALRIRERRRPRMPNQLGAHIEQRIVGAGSPNSNGCVERLQLTILEQCRRPAFARSLAPKSTALTKDLDEYLRYFNFHRAHTGRLTKGRIPAEIVHGARKTRTVRQTQTVATTRE
jgi:hypothetical protein